MRGQLAHEGQVEGVVLKPHLAEVGNMRLLAWIPAPIDQCRLATQISVPNRACGRQPTPLSEFSQPILGFTCCVLSIQNFSILQGVVFRVQIS
jgi:hypothetical protein